MDAQTKMDRRQHPRHFVRILVDYLASDTFLYDYSNDLSEGGIFIQTSTPLENGTLLELRFSLPGIDRIFKVQGEVKWVCRGAPQVAPPVANDEAEQTTEDASLAIDVLDDLIDGVSPINAVQPGATVPSADAEVTQPIADNPEVLPEGMGIRFLNMTDEDQALLREFLGRESY